MILRGNNITVSFTDWPLIQINFLQTIFLGNLRFYRKYNSEGNWGNLVKKKNLKKYNNTEI